MALATPPHRVNRLTIVLSILDTVLFAVIVGALLWRPVPDANRELVAAAVGFVAGWAAAWRSFLTGTTIGSEAKTQAIIDQSANQGVAQGNAGGPMAVDKMQVDAQNVDVTTPEKP